ncbi:MAG: AAA family ATPase [Deltaproteobacteria bacterium]|nr:AAA family ATPase [Deltaproteobacteria bacterium]
MDYFKILNLKAEPFSNSPEPEYFFQSLKHLGCLQKLELAIRLRRGLNVVIGDVGTGKTTLCRQLILKFSSSEEDRNRIETHLLLDPAFTTPIEFLSTVALTFGLKQSGNSDWQLKENIKTYLFEKGIEEGKTVVLIIDEGQKLPDFCLEILREFLNYETNEFKLLQIVIFAQTEFEQILKRQANFADRINLYYFLKPLNIRETCAMVKFRIAKASEADQAPDLFTYPGLLALYLATGGYPRKIVTLCHQAMLALIIQNRSKAGWFLVRSSDRRIASVQRRSLKWIGAAVFLLLMTAVAVTGLFPYLTRSINPDMEIQKPEKNISPVQRLPDAVSQTGKASVTEAVAKSSPVTPPVKKIMPEFLGNLRLKNGRTMWRMLKDFYGDFDRGQFKAVALANPHIKNLNRIKAGEMIKLPAIPSSSNPLPSGKFWLQVAGGGNIEETYELYRSYESALPSLKFLTYWNGREGLVFAVFVKDGVDGQEAAANMIKQLPQPLAVTAKVVEKPGADTVFFTK